MIEETRILPECNAETLLIRFIQGKQPAHYYGNSEVAKNMKNKKKKNKNEPLIGIVDNDKKIPPYLKLFTKIDELNNWLVLKQKSGTKQYIIFVCPEFEPWIWECAKMVKVNPAKWGYKNLKSLYRDTKHENLEDNNNFKNFLNAVIQKKPLPILTMKKWIDEILKSK